MMMMMMMRKTRVGEMSTAEASRHVEVKQRWAEWITQKQPLNQLHDFPY